ncbi:MAG: hypothetical protein M5U01_21530 [Ardenticatenaceae bacterium]|nr:hypothetical protein [Ardenticatenaceae bacterium]
MKGNLAGVSLPLGEVLRGCASAATIARNWTSSNAAQSASYSAGSLHTQARCSRSAITSSQPTALAMKRLNSWKAAWQQWRCVNDEEMRINT